MRSNSNNSLLMICALLRNLHFSKALYGINSSSPGISQKGNKLGGNFKSSSLLPTFFRSYSFSVSAVMQSDISDPVSFSALNFDNRNLRVLPVDKETRNFPRQVKNSIFSRCGPTPVNSPQLIAISVDALALLG
jgi:hypothetical protein